MNFEYSPYQLVWDIPGKDFEYHAASGDVSADRRGPACGALIRMHFQEIGPGYCDVRPWPSLGDEGLWDQLQKLAQASPAFLDPQWAQSPKAQGDAEPRELKSLSSAYFGSPLLERSFFYARMDALARRQKRSLFEGLMPVPSHLLILYWMQATQADLERWVSAGTRQIKLKLGADLEEETQKIKGWSHVIHRLGLKLRLDFNHRIRPDELAVFLESIGKARQWIEFIEDPFIYDSALWKKTQQNLGVALALDRLDEGKLTQVSEGSLSYWVVKPALQDPYEIAKRAQSLGVPLVLTHSLDHPLGQRCAALSAAQLAANLGTEKPWLAVCGLLTNENLRVIPAELREPFATETGTFTSESPRGSDSEPGMGSLQWSTFSESESGLGFESVLKQVSWRSWNAN